VGLFLCCWSRLHAHLQREHGQQAVLQYTKILILKDNVAASADEVLPESKERFFLMDSAPTHRGERPTEVLHNAGFTVLDFPP